MPELESPSLKRRFKRKSENALGKNLQSLLEDITYTGAAKSLVKIKPKEDSDTELELEERDSVTDIEDKVPVVETDPNKLVEESIFDFVVEMERQFDDLFEDIEEIKKVKTDKGKQKV